MLFVLWLKKNVGLKCFNKMEKFNYFKSTCLFLFKDCVSLLKVGTIKSQLMFSWVRFCCCTVLSLVRARAQHGWRENGFVQSFSYFTIYYYRFISKSLYLDVLWDVCKWINFNFSVFFGWGWGALTFYGGSLLMCEEEPIMCPLIINYLLFTSWWAMMIVLVWGHTLFSYWMGSFFSRPAKMRFLVLLKAPLRQRTQTRPLQWSMLPAVRRGAEQSPKRLAAQCASWWWVHVVWIDRPREKRKKYVLHLHFLKYHFTQWVLCIFTLSFSKY